MTLEQRLARLEAIEDIRQLKSRYFHACVSRSDDVGEKARLMAGV